MSIGLLDAPDARVLMEEPEDPRLRAFRLNACRKEPWTAEWIRKMRPGWMLWDVGANIGSYALYAGKRGLRVVAVEPGAENHAALCRNIILNQLGEAVTPLPFALGQQTGIASITYSDTQAGAALHKLNASKQSHQIVVLTLDDAVGGLRLPIPHYLKIDTDGYEFEVLLGAQQVLAHPQMQSLMIELSKGLEQAIMQWLAQRGYNLVQRFDERDGKPMGTAYGLFARVGVG